MHLNIFTLLFILLSKLTILKRLQKSQGLAQGVEADRADGTGGGIRDEGAKEEAPVALGPIFTFFNPLFASVNLKILFCRQRQF